MLCCRMSYERFVELVWVVQLQLLRPLLTQLLDSDDALVMEEVAEEDPPCHLLLHHRGNFQPLQSG